MLRKDDQSEARATGAHRLLMMCCDEHFQETTDISDLRHEAPSQSQLSNQPQRPIRNGRERYKVTFHQVCALFK